MRFPIFAVLTIVLSVSAFAQSKPIPKEVIQQLTTDDPSCRVTPKDLKATWVDLNNDQNPELIVKISAPCLCGASGNCSQVVFSKMEIGYVTLRDDLQGQMCYAASTVTNGYKDLVTEHHMGAAELAMTVYKWNGHAYEESACYTKENISKTNVPSYRITPRSCTEEESDNNVNTKPSYQSTGKSRSATALTLQAFTVAAGRYVYFPIQSNGNAVVSGRFNASGGSGNDIEVFILGQDEFTNWQNRHSVKTWFNSGRVTVANVSARLPIGTYYLVFNNNYSVVSPKAVTANITMIQ